MSQIESSRAEQNERGQTEIAMMLDWLDKLEEKNSAQEK